MDGDGAAMQSVVKDTVSYQPEVVIRCTDQLMECLPELDICIKVYRVKEVNKIQKKQKNSKNKKTKKNQFLNN